MKGQESVRFEQWGKIIYSFDTDEFRAEARRYQRLTPSAPIGIGWVIIGGCNLRCLHCYGNAEALPKNVLSTADCLKIVDRIAEARIMRVVISGGEPLLRKDIFIIIESLKSRGISVVLGTNGSFISETNASFLKMCTVVEVSLDAPHEELHNRIRPSRQIGGNAWQETMRGLKLLKQVGARTRILTAVNAWNQDQLAITADLLEDLGFEDWAVSWTIPAGRALAIYDQFRPRQEIVERQIAAARLRHPAMSIRYSDRVTAGFNRFYCLVLPDGQMSTEDITLGGKVSFCSLLEHPFSTAWNSRNYNRGQHFQKWVGSRVIRSIGSG